MPCKGTAKIKRAQDGSVLSAELHCPPEKCNTATDPNALKLCVKHRQTIPDAGEHGLKYEVEFCCCYSADDHREGKKHEPQPDCAPQLLRILRRQGEEEEAKLIDAYVFCDGSCPKTTEKCPPLPTPKKSPPDDSGSWTEDYACDCA